MLDRLKFPSSRKPEPRPTAAELRLLNVLWRLGEATVEQIVNAHEPLRIPNYKTTQTLLRIMESKGFVRHEAQGRVFVFKPLITRDSVDRKAVQNLVEQNFGGSAASLMINLLEVSPIDENDLNELESLIRQYRAKDRSQATVQIASGERR